MGALYFRGGRNRKHRTLIAARDIVFSKIGADWGFIYTQQEWDESDFSTEKANFLGSLN